MGKYLKFPEVISALAAQPDLVDLLRRSITMKREEKRMKHTIDVDNREQGEAINTALKNPLTKAGVLVIGVLEPLTPTQREKVLKFVQDALADSE